MVRFKNRYFLIELLPFFGEDLSFNTSSALKSKLKDRYHSEKNNVNDSNSNSIPELESIPSFTSASVSSCIRRAVGLNYGQYAAASLLQSLSVKYSNVSTKMIILRVPRDFATEIWASLTFMTEWPSEVISSGENLKCTWRSVHCAGTIRSCQKAAIKYSRKILLQAKPLEKSLKSFSDEVIEPLNKKLKTIDP